MPWSSPAKRMKEMVNAIKAIWGCWHEGKDLDFRGEFYKHTLMTPFFNPGRKPFWSSKNICRRRRPINDSSCS